MGRGRSTRAAGRWSWLAPFSIAAAAVAAALSGLATRPRLDPALRVSAVHVPLDPHDAGCERVGALRYHGGLWLRSDDPRFGGLSDLRVDADGRRLWAVSDCGRGFTALLVYDAEGRLDGIEEPRLYDLDEPSGRPLAIGEEDSESLVVDGDSLEVGFEGEGRVWAYAKDPPFGGPARPVPTPDGLRGCGSNGGIETMTLVDGTRRLLVCETRRGPSLDVPAWVGDGGGWTQRTYPLLFDGGWAGEPFRPTGATLLPDGDVLAVERRFPPWATRVVRLARADLEGAGVLHPVEIARIESPLSVDNFEGIDARTDGAGRTLVYLVSDDNDCAKIPGGRRGLGIQRTLLLSFVLER